MGYCSPQYQDFFYSNIQTGLTAELMDFTNFLTSAVICAELMDFTNYLGMTISAEMMDTLGVAIIMEGYDTASGQKKFVAPGDVLTKSDGSLLAGTGIVGATGIRGITGLQGISGETGLIGITGVVGITGVNISGITGLVGITGIAPQGITGLQGTTGIEGLTGLVGLTGAILTRGDTGIQGHTGLIGLTGVSLQGVTGLQGDTGLVGGATGLQGVTGFSPTGLAPQGSTGVLQGITGTIGITGISPRGIAGPPQTLSAQTQTSGASLSYAIPANTLTTNEQYLEFIVWGTGSNVGVNAPTTITVTLGVTTILNTIFAQDGTNGAFLVRGIILRTGASAEEIIVGEVNSGDLGSTTTQRTSATENLGTQLTLQVTTTANASGNSVRALVARKVLQA
jgi:hypothetical protein